MIVTAVDRLLAFGRKHPEARNALTVWLKTTRSIRWHNLLDVRLTYPHADGVNLGSGRTVIVFNVRGNHYRLIASIDYTMGVVNVLDVLTHAEYSKEKWKK